MRPDDNQAVVVLWERVASLEDKFDACKERLSETRQMVLDSRDTLIELAGRSGNNGTVGNLSKSVAGLSESVSKLSKDVHRLKLRLAMIASTGAAAGAGLVNWISGWWS